MAAITSNPSASDHTTSTSSIATGADVERRCLRGSERRVVRAIAEAMFSEDGEVDGARLDAHVLEVDAHVTAASPMLCFGLRLLLLVVRIAPVLLFFRLRTLENLSVAERVVVLSRLERSRFTGLSLAFVGWRTVMTLVFYEDPVELRALGYTSHERSRYKRGLPIAPPAAAVPVPAESGVRLRDPDASSERESIESIETTEADDAARVA